MFIIFLLIVLALPGLAAAAVITPATAETDSLPVPTLPAAASPDLNSTAEIPADLLLGNWTAPAPGSNEGNSTVLDGGCVVQCKTTRASPSIGCAYQSSAKLNSMMFNPCMQINNWGSMCTTMSISCDAAVSICGNRGVTMTCWEAALDLRKIIQACAWEGKAGGQCVYPHTQSPKKIVLYHS